MSVTVFGGGAVQTAYVSFIALDITANDITLVWPTSYFDVPSIVDGIHYNVLGASLTVNNALANTKTITLPDATQSSVGSNFIIKNIGASSFRLLKSDGNELIVIPNAPDTSNSFWVQLIDNSTPEGTWQFVQFGAGTSQAQAAALAGNGLVSLAGLLNTNINVSSIANTPYQVLLTDRAKLLIWQTGTGQILLPVIASPVPNGFNFSVNNEGSGIITIVGDATIDNKVSITVSPGQSLSIISDGIKWWSLGFGQNIASSNFIPGSEIAPSITFTTDPTTGIYYYQTPSPPVDPPGIGFSVNSSQIANFSSSGLYMNSGNDITLLDSTSVSETKLISNASYGKLSWNNIGAATPSTLSVSGTDTESTLTLGPFATLSFSQSDTNAIMAFNSIDVLFLDDTGASLFVHDVTFQSPIVIQNLSTFSNKSTFNGAAIFNGNATFNGTITLSTPLSIANGGTGQNNRQSALNALMSNAPAVGDLIYYDSSNNWVRLPIGAVGSVLTVTNDGLNDVPAWV